MFKKQTLRATAILILLLLVFATSCHAPAGEWVGR
jgi:hypothetical protein